MKRFKMALSLLVVTSLLLSVPASFAATKTLTLEEAITLSKEKSAAIRAVENQAFSTQDTIRQNIQNSYQLEGALDTYYDYIELYNTVVEYDGEHPWYKYIGESTGDLTRAIGTQDPIDPTNSTGLTGKIFEATMAGQTDKVKEYTDEITFISLYMAFGDNPTLTKETKYEQFKKNEAMLQNSVDLINTQYQQGLIAATKGTEAGIIQLYVGLKDLYQGLEVKKDMLQTYEDGLVNMEESYNQGMVSSLDYENQVRTVKIQRLDVENMQYQYDNLAYQLKNMCGLTMDTSLNLSTAFENGEYVLNAPSTYFETAYANNMDYVNLDANLTYNEKNFEVMNKYLDDMEDDKDFTKPIYYQEKVDQQEDIDDLNQEIENKKKSIEANIAQAYNDLLLKKKKVEYNDDSLKLAEAQLNSGIQSYKLGQITQLQLDQLKLQYASTLMTATQNTRAYNTGVENFKLLINYGVTYNTGQ